jgi:hypothetical protein
LSSMPVQLTSGAPPVGRARMRRPPMPLPKRPQANAVAEQRARQPHGIGWSSRSGAKRPLFAQRISGAALRASGCCRRITPRQLDSTGAGESRSRGAALNGGVSRCRCLNRTPAMRKVAIVQLTQCSRRSEAVIADPTELRAYECDADRYCRRWPWCCRPPRRWRRRRVCRRVGEGGAVGLRQPRRGALPTADSVILGVARLTQVLETDCERLTGYRPPQLA